MRNGFSTLNVKSAVRDHSKISDFCSLQTTLNFGQLIPIFATELVPGDKFNVSADLFSRCAPLAVPTYGKAEIKTASFFIPYYQIAKDADAWISGQRYYRSVSTKQRFMKLKDLFDFFNYTISGSTQISNAGSESSFDWKYKDSSGVHYMKFTQYGKFCYKVLRNLGYQIPAGIDTTSGSSWATSTGEKTVSVYPILAFFKAYNDWMMQSQAFNTHPLTSLLYQIKLGNNVSGKFSNGNLTGAGLRAMFENLRVLYSNDYITSSWRYPNSPMGDDSTVTSAAFPLSNVKDINVTRSNNNVAYSLSQDASLTQRSLDFLRRFDDWVRRNNYAGSRDVQQIYARMGVKTDDFKSHYAYLLDRSTYPLSVGDVTSTADTQSDPNDDKGALGSYTGKGIISAESKTSFESSDYGLLLVVAWIAVKPVYADGFDKMVLKSEPFDYFNPEFDALGPQAISLMEVSERNKDFVYGTTPASDGVFGFTEKYNDMRIFRDKVSGDFTIFADSGMDAWHFNRDLSAVRNAGSLVAQSASMMYMSPVDSEYNRIFQITDGEEDKFYLTIGFNINALRPMKSLNQTADLGDGNKVIERNGNTVQ